MRVTLPRVNISWLCRSSALLILLVLGMTSMAPRARAEPFDVDWLITTPIGSTGDGATSMVVQPDGKYVLGGWTEVVGSRRDFALARYTVDGILDPSFGNGGIVVPNFDANSKSITALATDSDGRILAVGHTDVGTDYELAVARFLPDGGADTSFDSDGFLQLDIRTDDFAYGIHPLPDGTILITGETYVTNPGPAEDDTFAVKLDASGMLDNNFGIGGVAIHRLNDGRESIRSMLVDPLGRIVVSSTD